MTDSEFLHSGDAKKNQVQAMFDGVARRYDFLNHFLSLGIDLYWRRQAVQALRLENGQHLLDVATGTGDQGFSALKAADIQVTGLDFSFNMLKLAQKKIRHRKLEKRFRVVQGDAENLPFSDNSFEALSISYGIRNVGTISRALAEFQRVLKPGGRVAILEFAEPESWFFGGLYRFYFDHILPKVAGLFSSESAYTYLPESVRHFPSRQAFKDQLTAAGFQVVRHRNLTFGVTVIYSGEKPVAS
jgi:demethylmenaquinone methyltransferase/2-methoxy-6-polyprenyl-1,4-benzoquinol methylase